MIKYTNIQKRRATLNLLYSIQTKHYQNLVVRFGNTNLCRINKLIKKIIFHKNDLYADATTLHELMQPVGGKGKHNYHGLTPEIVLEATKNVNDPLCILSENNYKYACIIPTQDENGNPLLVVIQTKCGLNEDENAGINKLVTIFPKEKVHKYLKSFSIEQIVYLNQVELDKIK